MAYPSNDEFDDELPDMQLLLEQKTAKPRKEKVVLPSLFDPVTPPKSKPKPKPDSQTTKLGPATKPKTVRKKKTIAVETPGDDSTPRGRKEVRAKGVTTVKKQVLKTITQETATKEGVVKAVERKAGNGAVAYPEIPSLAVASSVLSDSLDYASAAEKVEEVIQPTPPRRRRLVLKKYLISDDDDDSDDSYKEPEQETVKKLQRAVVDLTLSDSEEELPRAQRPKAQTERATSEGEGFESHGSLDDIRGAVLTYSPPRSSKPRKILPPANSSKEPFTGRKPSSPKKKAFQIPPTNHRLSSDAFWDQEVTNSWIDSHTPYKKPGVTQNFFDTANDEIPEESDGEEEEDGVVEVKRPATSKATPFNSSRNVAPKEPKEKSESKRAFNARKKQLAEEFLKTVDDKISGGEVARKTASTGGVKIVWSKSLRTTAGTAKWRMEKLQNASGQVSLGDPLSSDRVRHNATIELSEKVVDSEDKLYNVLCHEYCHLANYMISNVRKPPHGASFKKWASLCSHTFSDLNVHVTTTHSYEIEAKFKWACQTCGYVYKRHSQSIDTTRYSCGACKSGKLVQTHPPPKEKRPITGYQAFMKDHFGRIKAENPGTPQKELMRIVAESYRATKSVGDPGQTEFVELGGKEGELENMFGGLKV